MATIGKCFKGKHILRGCLFLSSSISETECVPATEICQEHASFKLFSLIIWNRVFFTKVLAFANLNNQNGLPFPSSEWQRGLQRTCEFISEVNSEKRFSGCPKQTIQAKPHNILLISIKIVVLSLS